MHDAAARAPIHQRYVPPSACWALPRRDTASRRDGARAAAVIWRILLPEMRPGGRLDERRLPALREASWDYITRQYREFCTDPSFVDYFWTIRIMHAPVWRWCASRAN